MITSCFISPTILFVRFQAAKMMYGQTYSEGRPEYGVKPRRKELDSCGQCTRYLLIAINIVFFVSVSFFLIWLHSNLFGLVLFLRFVVRVIGGLNVRYGIYLQMDVAFFLFQIFNPSALKLLNQNRNEIALSFHPLFWD